MKSMTQLRKRKGVSPVIATVILVAVTITVAVAVAYWMSGIAGQYTAFEKVEIQSGICTLDTAATPLYWQIVVTLKNSGTKAATLTSVFVNDVESIVNSTVPTTSGSTLGNDLPVAGLPILSGAVDSVTIWIGNGGTLSAGTTVNIKIHSAVGMDYIKLVQLN